MRPDTRRLPVRPVRDIQEPGPAAAGRLGVLRLVLAVLLAAVAGLLALMVVAAVTARPVLFLGAGLLAFLAATAAGVEERQSRPSIGHARAPLVVILLTSQTPPT